VTTRTMVYAALLGQLQLHVTYKLNDNYVTESRRKVSWPGASPNKLRTTTIMDYV